MYHIVKHAVHRMLFSWWLYTQSIKSGSVYIVGANPMRGVSSVQVTIIPCTLDTFSVLNVYDLLTICNNHLCKHFNFINFIDFASLAYKRKDSLKILSIHRNT
jgi:hypothetical protein